MTDEWSGLADLLANLIEKYASKLGIDEMPDPALKADAESTGDRTEENCEINIADNEVA